MSRSKMHDMSVDALVQLFIRIALDQDRAMRVDDNVKYNRLYGQMEDVEEELKGRAGDQRRALIPLLGHSNPQVRLKSAIATLALAPETARRALQTISDWNEYPQAADARGVMSALDEGRFIAT